MESTVAQIKDLPAGRMIGVDADGKSILIANVNGAYYAIGDICTHMGCKLSEGTLVGETVECPCHGSVFSLRDGRVLNGPARDPEPVFKVRTDGNRIVAGT